MESTAEKTLECSNCKRILEKKHFVKHHLVPRQKGGTHIEDNTIFLCRACEKQLHNLYPNSKLKRDFNTLEKIVNDSEMKKPDKGLVVKIATTDKCKQNYGRHGDIRIYTLLSQRLCPKRMETFKYQQ